MKEKDKIGIEEYLKVIKEKEKLESLIFPVMQNRMEDKVVNGLFHDIRNRFIKISQLLNELKTDSKGHYLIQKIANVAEGVELEMRSIGFLLESLRSKNNYKKELVDLAELIEFVIYSMRLSEVDIEFQFESNDTPNLLVNRAKLFLVIYELIKNSIDAILLNERIQGYGFIRVTTNLIDKNYEIIFEDNGVGVPNEIIQKITKSGFSTKNDGSGLGLAFVKDFIQNEMNGELRIRSKVKRGTAMIIMIPEYMNYVD